MSASEPSPEPYPGPYPPVAQLVPHEPPMLLVDELIAWTSTTAQVRAKVRAGGPFVVEGRVPASILLEYMAQAIAVADGMTGHVTGREGIGLLLGSRELRFEVDGVEVGDTLDMFVEQQFADSKIASYACRLEREGVQLASGVINVMITTAQEVMGA